MLLTKRFNDALIFSAICHKNQIRKADGYPFIMHPFALASLLIKYNATEDAVIGGLLHDVLEDTPYTAEEIEGKFGSNVLGIVQAVSENKTLPWRERKIDYVERLVDENEEALMVSCADKIHNLFCFLREYEAQGEALWQHFNAGRDDTFWFFQEVYNVLKPKLKSSMIKEYEPLIQEMNKILSNN